MIPRTKSIALFTFSCTLTSCDKKPERKPVTAPPVEVKSPAQPPKKLTPFQKEIQKMLDEAKGDEAVLRAFLKGKPKKNNAGYVKQGINDYVTKHGKRPKNQAIVDTLGNLHLLNTSMRKEEVLERIEKRLSDQLEKEQRQ